MKVIINKIGIDKYSFGTNNNPYEYGNTDQPIALADIAKQISAEIDSSVAFGGLIIRGIQSGKHDLSKEDLLQVIIKNGREYESTAEPNTIFAALYESRDTILHILEGFHKYKPKSEERPQYPVDIWLIFDARAYENIEYLHPRYNVLARDKWKRVDPTETGLVEVIVLKQ